jgi:hypothetical protein
MEETDKSGVKYTEPFFYAGLLKDFLLRGYYIASFFFRSLVQRKYILLVRLQINKVINLGGNRSFSLR